MRMFRIRAASEIEPSHCFLVFYTVALLADVDDIILRASGLIIAALCLWVVLCLNRISFLVLLLATTAQFVIFELPDTENHTNLLIFTNISMILCILYSYTRADRGNMDVFAAAALPIARLSIIAALFSAGLHKFNYDFINPAVSCIRQFGGDIFQVFTSDFSGFGPAPLTVLLGMLLVVAVLLWLQRPHLAMPPVDWPGLLPPLAIILLGMVGLAFLSGGLGTSAYDYLIFVIAVAVLSWQLVEAPLLLLPKFQWFALCFSLLVHLQLAVLRIVDFQAIAIALIIAFVPATVWDAWKRQALARIGPFQVHRLRLFFAMNLAGTAIMFAQGLDLIDWPRPLTAWGLLFIGGLLVMLWPVISDLFSPARGWRWEGVPVLQGQVPTWLYVMPVLVLMFGLTSHMGLRTAGNLSMYSNLRTELGQNNHIILGASPLKWAGYQEDVVHIIDIGDTATISGVLDRWGPLEGNYLPVVEFHKLMWRWRERGETVPMTVEYAGVTTTSDNLPLDPAWRVDNWDWEMRVMDFRVIESGDGPNHCRW
ncbi:hypothetical protein KX928_15400 [Roseobacter sp. YSTF-M11]|uniref:Uncharacterized protein n=1 Tax=Roseobacter insulae TaxID=2859783 RepID=A0A9X1FWY7_9RHOB|nr:hypothetical protein [Roseobacter insulae]MBW4709177.1 hypothetical protein [Roseobacter insulae]